MAKITKRTVDGAQPSKNGRRYLVWDEALKGFGLLVLPSGVRSFVFDYRNKEGRKRRATIGKVGTITPDKARKLAEGMAENVKRGGDPLADKAKARMAPTMDELFDAYLESHRFAEKAESTQSIDRGRIRHHLRPLLGRVHVHTLRPEDVRKVFNAIRMGKTKADVKTKTRGRARVHGGEGTARAAIRLLRAILSWAVEEGLAEKNPASGISIGVDGKRETILEGPEHYAALFSTLDTMVEELRLRSPVADVIRVIALTGARCGEIVGAQWRHVDLKAGTITLPYTSHKTGRKTGQNRVITLPSIAMEIIARQPEGKGSDLVFQPARGRGPISMVKPWRKVREEAGLPKGIGLHGLRHSLASLMAMDGAQPAEIMAALGHKDISTSMRYVHFAEKARSTLAERAAAPALAGLAAASGKAGADVVKLKQGEGDG